ncbi:MAG: bifunctional phosphoribosyl-AMP cyclohydrolase/phosphoribosyl-ATP diphosphatase HisIE [Bacillota bacterium]
MSVEIEELQFDGRGLIPVVVQDDATGEILMLAYANAEALKSTLDTGRAHFYSRSRGEIWDKGATSGNVMEVSAIGVDCDADALVYSVAPAGPACHTGARSCFWRSLAGGAGPYVGGGIIAELAEVIADRERNPRSGSYVSSLLEGLLEDVLRKVGEEATEVMLAGAMDRKNMEIEVADLWFHSLVALRACGGDYRGVLKELRRRRR